MRYLGLDYGTKTVGLAVSDRTGFLASNYGVIRYSDTSEIFKELEKIVKDEKIISVNFGNQILYDYMFFKKTLEVIMKSRLTKENILSIFEQLKNYGLITMVEVEKGFIVSRFVKSTFSQAPEVALKVKYSFRSLVAIAMAYIGACTETVTAFIPAKFFVSTRFVGRIKMSFGISYNTRFS